MMVAHYTEVCCKEILCSGELILRAVMRLRTGVVVFIFVLLFNMKYLSCHVFLFFTVFQEEYITVFHFIFRV